MTVAFKPIKRWYSKNRRDCDSQTIIVDFARSGWEFKYNYHTVVVKRVIFLSQSTWQRQINHLWYVSFDKAVLSIRFWLQYLPQEIVCDVWDGVKEARHSKKPQEVDLPGDAFSRFPRDKGEIGLWLSRIWCVDEALGRTEWTDWRNARCVWLPLEVEATAQFGSLFLGTLASSLVVVWVKGSGVFI
jgi:hypothetical protein